MNAREAYETTLWNSIPYDIRRSISDSTAHGELSTSYYILVGTPMWNDHPSIIDTLTKLGYKTELKTQAADSQCRIIEYKLNIYWDNPRK